MSDIKNKISIYIRDKMLNVDKNELIKLISIITIILYPIIRLIFSEIINNQKIANYVTLLLIGILFLPGTINIIVKKTKKTLILSGIFIIAVLINYILHFQTIGQTINIVIKNFITCYIMFMIVVNIEQKEMLFKSLKVGGYFATVLTLIYIILMQDNKTLLFENGLALQLVLIIFLPINLTYAFTEKKTLNIIFTIIETLVICCFSSRTIIATTFALILLLTTIHYIKWLKSIQDGKKKRIILVLTLVLISLIFIMLINIQGISTSIYNFLQDKGIYIRSLRLLSEGKYFSYSSGRTDTVYPEMMKKISDSPILGHGIGMDRIIDGDNTYYAHNIVLEIYVSYGIIIGSAIILGIITIIAKALKSEYRLFVIDFMFSGLIIMMLTTSYTIYRGFWLMLGVLINILNLKIKIGRNKNEHEGRII